MSDANRWTPEQLAAVAIARLYFNLGKYGPRPGNADLTEALDYVMPFFVSIRDAAASATEGQTPLEAAAKAYREAEMLMRPGNHRGVS